jgi:hypothetical protein
MGKHLPFLVQERAGDPPHIYAWTADLARKVDMRPITTGQAMKIREQLKAAALAKFNIDVTEDPEDTDPIDDDQDHDNAILTDLDAKDKEQVAPAGDEPKPLVVSQTDIFDEDFRKVRSFRKTASIEEYILKKYKIDMIPMESLGDMQDQSREILTSLMQGNALFQSQ